MEEPLVNSKVSLAIRREIKVYNVKKGVNFVMDEKYHDFKYGAAFQFAFDVQEAIYSQNISVLDYASDFDKQISKPQKNTILHDVIEYFINEHFSIIYFNHNFDVTSLEEIDGFENNEVMHLFNEFQISYLSPQEYLKQNKGNFFSYGYDYLRKVSEENLSPILKVEVFNLLFNDRELMKEFNKLIANDLEERVIRCRSWPKWLERALFCREKGLCAICKKDLTCLFHTKNKPAIDHIVPIGLKGVNDPTNLQMLCDKCNGRKSNTRIITSNSTSLSGILCN